MRRIILLALIAFMLAGCKYNAEASISLTLNTVVIDSCEYVSAYGRLAHKGNCRFCTERRRQEMKDLIKELKEE